MSLKLNWTFSVDFRTTDSDSMLVSKWNQLIREYHELNPNISSLDTETNGLHIKNCHPFLVAF